MANLVAVNTLILLKDDSLYCQPRVALYSPSGNDTAADSSASYYYVTLVDLPSTANFPAPTNPAQIQADGSLFYPYTCADGSLPPDTPPAGVPLVTYILPIWGGNPATTQSGLDTIFPSVYFAVVDPKHKGTVKRPTTAEGPAVPNQPVYACQPFVVKSATNTGQIWAGNLVFIYTGDTCTSYTGSGNVSLIVNQANQPNSQCKSFQGFLAGSLQPTAPNGVIDVNVVFSPNNSPSGQPAAAFGYRDSDMTKL